MSSKIWLDAAQKGKIVILKQMVKTLKHFDVNSLTTLGQSALMLAASGNYINIVYFLMEIGADIHIIDKFGENAISLAIRRSNKKIYNFLYEKGCRVSPTFLQNASDSQLKIIEHLKIKDWWKRSRHLFILNLQHKITLI